jgi:murein DD-endopeptidase MepM/ murein hydrolase activator NlpD
VFTGLVLRQVLAQRVTEALRDDSSDEPRAGQRLSIAGRAGAPVRPAPDGRVVYPGTGLRGYGNMGIISHKAAV